MKPEIKALENWMQEVTSLLCYQPDIPMKHKEDLCAALNEYLGVIKALEITSPPPNENSKL